MGRTRRAKTARQIDLDRDELLHCIVRLRKSRAATNHVPRLGLLGYKVKQFRRTSDGTELASM